MHELLMSFQTSSIFSDKMLQMIDSPMFYEQLTPEEVIAFGKYALVLAQGNRTFEGRLCCSFMLPYFYYNLDILDGGMIDSLIDISIALELTGVQRSICMLVKEYNIRPGRKYCVILATMCLKAREGDHAIRKLAVLQYFGYFTKFTKEARQDGIDYWSARVKKRAQEGLGTEEADNLLLKILRFKFEKAEEDDEGKVLELLERLDSNRPPCEETELRLQICLRLLRHGSLSRRFLCEVCERLLKMKRRLLAHETASTLHLAKRRQQMELDAVFDVLSGARQAPAWPEDTPEDEFLRDQNLLYLSYDAALELVLRALIDPFPQKIILQIWGLGKTNLHGVFRKELEDKRNAEALFEKMDKRRLHSIMPLFNRYFSGILFYGECIAENMSEIIESMSPEGPSDRPELFGSRYDGKTRLEVLHTLANSHSGKIEEALYKHFADYLQVVFEQDIPQLHLCNLLQPIFARKKFADVMTTEQMILIFSWGLDGEESKFEMLREIFLFNVKDEDARGKMLDAVLCLLCSDNTGPRRPQLVAFCEKLTGG